ncbi:MAG: MFS transporter [Candidatus Bathyarchaeota archaeon]|nr:MAG: MFS transporter [Candidatus Bathyarchaeota archaeon]
MRAFTIVWIGQLVSLLGTAMAGFALAYWAYITTGTATALALVGFFAFAPTMLISPVAGALVDRWNRKLMMMLSDLAAISSTAVVLLLYTTGNLQIWHLYITGAFASVFGAFQFPAYSAAVTTMVSKKQYGRASGMLSTAQFASGIFAPILAAALIITPIGIGGILTIDILTFLVAIGALLIVHIPQPIVTEEGLKSRGSLWKESIYGFRYIFKRPGLLGLQLVFFSINLVAVFGNTVSTPMILARTGNDAAVLGIVQSIMGVGGVVGSVVLSVWGGPKRRVHGVLAGMGLGMTGMVLMGLGRNLYVWSIAAFISLFFIPIINGSNQAIWQSKVAPDVQGRVFATRALIAQISVPVAMLLSGPLADYYFEPALMADGSLQPVFGWLVGIGPGAGMALMFVIAGVCGVFIGFGGYTIKAVRDVEDVIPDHQAAVNPNRAATADADIHSSSRPS